MCSTDFKNSLSLTTANLQARASAAVLSITAGGDQFSTAASLVLFHDGPWVGLNINKLHALSAQHFPYKNIFHD